MSENVPVVRYVATWSALDRSLRSDRTKGLVGHGSVATLRPTEWLGRSWAGLYVANDRMAWLVAT
ncbi:hypothetical protein DY000_02047003 [Brassica cretica]|uniref:Uncharacterized protein n=1 Tax=Brassica cretica TaxID=69181 RepID=A0ABQ7F6A9_BRACR|nr:hypothetical protein DY000_02047003 [Brassica cretica]